MTPRVFTQIIPTLIIAFYGATIALRARTFRRYLKDKPRTADAASENIEKFKIGRDEVYITRSEYRSMRLQIYFAFFLQGLLVLSIVSGVVFTRLYKS